MLKLTNILTEETNTVNVEINVKDTGIGISQDKQDKIFLPFFQCEMPDNIINPGSGIGLYITNEFVKLYGGTIIVKSKPNKGSCFTINLTLKKLEGSEISDISIDRNIELQERNTNIENFSETVTENNIPLLLLVEDDDDFRFYLKDNLKASYKIIEADNGKEAWNQVLLNVPDLIISDVMMPEMDGLEFCTLVKTDKRTCHIPVILFSAKASSDKKLEGLEAGADDYIAKPFDLEILESRIKNLVHQRELLRGVFQKHILVKPYDINIISLDEKLIQKALDLVERNISNPDFSVVDLSRELGMSRAYLYKKLLAITGKTPIEFIRSLRLQRAVQLLEKSQLTVSEIAYEVGFNNPKLFSKYFKKDFTNTPSQYREYRIPARLVRDSITTVS